MEERALMSGVDVLFSHSKHLIKMTDSITYTSKVFFCQPYFIEKFSIQHECSA